MRNYGSKTILVSAALAAFPSIVTGCGSTTATHDSASTEHGGGKLAEKKDKYKPQDPELVAHANSIPVYSTPDNTRQVMRRAPDDVVDEGNGAQTYYYNADNSPNSERLRLRFNNGRLINKEIIPPDVNAKANDNTRPQNYPASNAANYIDMREYDPKTGTAAKPSANGSNAANPNDNANAQLNNDFNARLNAANPR